MGLKLMTDLPIMSQTQYQMHHATIKKTPDKSLTNTIPALPVFRRHYNIDNNNMEQKNKGLLQQCNKT